jgi:hypothetical protein
MGTSTTTPSKRISSWVLFISLATAIVVTTSMPSDASRLNNSIDPGITVPGWEIFNRNDDIDEWSRAYSYASTGPDCTSIYVAPCQAVEGHRLTSRTAADGKHVNFHIAGGQYVNTKSVLGFCKSQLELNCVAGLRVSDDSGTESGSYVSDFAAGTPFIGDITKGIPDGKYAPLFSMPNYLNATKSGRKDLYMVRVRVDGHHQLINCTGSKNYRSSYCREKRNFISVSTGINEGASMDCTKSVPSDLISYCKDRKRWQRLELGTSKLKVDVFAVSVAPNGMMTPVAELPPTFEFEVTFRVNDEISPRGWFSGRVNAPSLRQTRITGGLEIALGGGVSDVFGMATNITCSTLGLLPQAQIDAINNYRMKWARWNNWRGEDSYIAANPGKTYSDQIPSDSCLPTAPRLNSPPLLRSLKIGNGVSGIGNCSEMLVAEYIASDSKLRECMGVVSFAEVAAAQGDRVTHLAHRWSLQNVYHNLWDRTADTFALDRCAGDALVGIVGTNATLYDELPRIDGQTGQLEYQMAAPHFGIDGTATTVGKYSLTVTKDLAKCQWGVNPNSTTFTAKVVEGALEQTKTQVTVASDAQVFRISVTGFHFSKPKAKVTVKDKSKPTIRSVRVRPSQRLSITRLSKSTSTVVSTWFLTSGKCKMSKNKLTIQMAKKGVCTATLSRFNTKTKKSVRQTIRLSP